MKGIKNILLKKVRWNWEDKGCDNKYEITVKCWHSNSYYKHYNLTADIEKKLGPSTITKTPKEFEYVKTDTALSLGGL